MLLGWIGRDLLRDYPFVRRFCLHRFGRDVPCSDGFGTKPASLQIFGDDLLDDRGQGRHLEQGESNPDSAQVLGAVPVVQTSSGDGAHLVVELGPANVAAPIAETYEVDRLGLTWSGIGR